MDQALRRSATTGRDARPPHQDSGARAAVAPIKKVAELTDAGATRGPAARATRWSLNRRVKAVTDEIRSGRRPLAVLALAVMVLGYGSRCTVSQTPRRSSFASVSRCGGHRPWDQFQGPLIDSVILIDKRVVFQTWI